MKMLRELPNLLTTGELGYSAGLAADLIADEVRRQAPEGPTGNLKKGVVSKVNKLAAVLGEGSAYIGFNYKVARHAHLVEYGTLGARFPKKKPFMWFMWNGKLVRASKVKAMPANPFFRNSIDAKTGEAAAVVSADLLQRMTKKLEGK